MQRDAHGEMYGLRKILDEKVRCVGVENREDNVLPVF